MMSVARAVNVNRPRSLSVLTLVIAGMWGTTACEAQERGEGDLFEGALWNFSMRPKNPGPPPLRGRFRVKFNALYQRSSPEDNELTKPVGTKVAGGKNRVRVTFTDVAAVGPQGGLHEGIQGNVLITIDRPGEWSGTFVDSKGRHWDFRCTRIQE